MPKENKVIFTCSKCGAQFPKWFGQCPECGAWGTLVKQKLFTSDKNNQQKITNIINFNKVEAKDYPRFKTKIGELDRVLGGGVVPGSLILLGGAPGIGKSTLVLQIANSLNKPVLYISGEESAGQIKLRLNRLNIFNKNLNFLGETNIDIICSAIENYRPSLAIIDSIQTMHLDTIDSEAGSVNQVKSCTAKLLSIAKKTGIAIFIIGHITKEGAVAGPKTLEHLVDTVLYLEGDSFHHFRLLRSVKNRFGSTNEVGVFDMQQNGLVEIKNPSKIFLTGRELEVNGQVITSIIKGSRSFLVEVQALVTRTSFGYPQRRCAGFDINRLILLIAVLRKRCGILLGNQDVQINIVGGLKISEPAIDLAVALSIVSAFKNKPINQDAVVFGEIGLAGEVRPVSFAEERIKEAYRMGFKQIIMPVSNVSLVEPKIKITQVKNLSQAIKIAII